MSKVIVKRKSKRLNIKAKKRIGRYNYIGSNPYRGWFCCARAYIMLGPSPRPNTGVKPRC